MTGGVLLLHNYSAGHAMSPTRPPGQLRVMGQAGSLVGEQAIFVDRDEVARRRVRRSCGLRIRSACRIQRSGTVEWTDPFADTPLTEEQRAVALHVRGLSRRCSR